MRDIVKGVSVTGIVVRPEKVKKITANLSLAVQICGILFYLFQDFQDPVSNWLPRKITPSGLRKGKI